jgi:hypothetical protein
LPLPAWFATGSALKLPSKSRRVTRAAESGPDLHASYSQTHAPPASPRSRRWSGATIRLQSRSCGGSSGCSRSRSTDATSRSALGYQRSSLTAPADKTVQTTSVLRHWLQHCEAHRWRVRGPAPCSSVLLRLDLEHAVALRRLGSHFVLTAPGTLAVRFSHVHSHIVAVLT